MNIQYPDKDFPENYWLIIGFDGDRAELWMDGELCGDWFYTGNDWQIGLKYFDWPKQMTIRIYPVKDPCADRVPDFSWNSGIEKKVYIIPWRLPHQTRTAHLWRQK